MDHGMVAPPERVYWTFSRVGVLGMLPTTVGDGTDEFTKCHIKNGIIKVVYVAYEGHPDHPGAILYVGYGKPSRPLWAHGGGARARCCALKAFHADPTFTIEIVAMGEDWQGLSLLEDYIFLHLKPGLNISRPKSKYPLSAHETASKFWKDNWLSVFNQNDYMEKLNRQ